MQLPQRITLVLLIPILCAGCGGSGPAADSARPSSSTVPRIAPPQRASEPAAEPEPDPVAPTPTPAERRIIGAWLQWQLASGPIVEGKSYLRLLPGPGAARVLQLTSYDIPVHEEHPSLIIRATTRANSLAELVQQKLPAKLAIQVEADGNLIHNQPGQTVELIITEIDGKNVRGSFSGQAHDIDSGGNGPITGKFQAIVE